MKRSAGIAFKLTLGVIIFGITLGLVCSIAGYIEFTAVLEHQYNDSAYEIAEAAAALLNPDKFEYYLETGETDEEYKEVQARLDGLANASDVTFIYVEKVDTKDFSTVTYIYDSVNKNSGYKRYPFGYTERGIADIHIDDMKNIVLKGERASKYLYIYSEEWGAHTTAGLPVRDSRGNIAAVVCVEKPMTLLVNARSTYVVHVILVTLAALALFIFVFSLILNRSVIKPVLTVAEEAGRFAETNTPSEELYVIKKKDELGILARAVKKMETDIAEYTCELTAVTAEKERVNTELSVASRIQASMLPAAFPRRREFDICASMTPAREVGGDFYDFFMADDRHLAVVIADVSGKGIPAALFMVIGKTLIKDHTQPDADPADVFTEVNRLLCSSNSEGLFITAFEGVLDLVSGSFRFVNAGHEMPFICKKGGSFEPHRVPSGFVLAGMENIRYSCGEIQLDEGDMIFQYTDGVTEATNSQNELYGTDRLAEALGKYSGLSPAELLPEIKSDIDSFVGEAPQFDDITMLCLEYKSKMEERK